MPPPNARFVPDEGSKHARIVVVGEAPGRRENQKGRPFIGPSWTQRLHPWLSEVGLDRSDLYITNVYPYQPPNNQLSAIPASEREPWIADLHVRIAALTDPIVLVPMGEYALAALTGKHGIGRHRGSIYEYVDQQRGRSLKVIPTFHPASTFRKLAWERACRADWKRIAGDVQFRELRLPVREHYIRPTMDDLRYFAEDAAKADILGFDIETPRTLIDHDVALKSGKVVTKQKLGPARIACIGLALTPSFSITVPTTAAYWGSRTLPKVWEWLRALLALPLPKVAQSGMPFDGWWLRQPEYACPVTNYVYDTRWMHHALDSLDLHSLEYMASIELREPFWKNEGKVEGDLARMPRDQDQFFKYCGKDVACTVELANLFEPRLVKRKLWDFYLDWYVNMYEPLLRMSLHGTRLDEQARRRHVAQMTANMIGYQDRLTELAGEPLYSTAKHAKGDISNAKLAHYLYDTLGLPKATKTRKTKGGGEKVKTVTADEVTVRRLMLQFPEPLTEAGNLILNYRHDAKQVSSFSTRVADPDGRVRSSYGLASTLRLTSAKNPGRSGRNMQNIDREKAVRRMFLPDEGKLFIEWDESTAESRVVYVRTEDPRLIEIAHTQPWEFDDHKRVASIVLQKAMDDVTKAERQVAGKTTNHASNYGEKGKQMSDTLLKEGIIRTPEECQTWLDRRLAVDDGIPRWHAAVRRAALRDHRLVNAFGAQIDVTHVRFSDDMYRMLYAWEPQSTVVMLVNQYGLIPLDEAIRAGRFPNTRINLQTHDSVTASIPPTEEAWEVARFVHASLTRELHYGPKAIPLTIPVEMKLGDTLAMSHEFKRFPSKDEFMAAIKELAR